MIKAILIDDEANARSGLLKKLQVFCPEINVVAECSNGMEGIKAIKLHQPDLIFLDIEMPHMNGFTMLENIAIKNFEVIFTTAYNQYAINAIRFGAFDYLVKPVDSADLQKLMARFHTKKDHFQLGERMEILMEQLNVQKEKEKQKIAIATQEGLEIVSLDNIIHLEANSNYTKIYFQDSPKPLLASKTLKEFEELLQNNGFFRIHNASLVHIRFIKKYIKGDGGQVLLTDGTILDVARRRKDELLELIAKIAPKI